MMLATTTNTPTDPFTFEARDMPGIPRRRAEKKPKTKQHDHR
jgi:hypothetical protein